MSNVPFAAQMEELAAFFASKISVPTIGIGGGGMPIGATIPFDITNGAPLDWLVCDGTVYNIADYPQLAAWYESQHGSKNFYGGNGTTTFAVPDLRGEYIRGAGTNSHAGQGSGANVGVHQDATRSINHVTNGSGTDEFIFYDGEAWTNVVNPDSQATSSYAMQIGLGRTATTQANKGSYTSRPTSTSYTWCVKAVCAGEVYSTEERVVGTWIDSKPIYQKTLTGVLPTITAGSYGRVDIDLGFAIDTTCYIYGVFQSDTSDFIIPNASDDMATQIKCNIVKQAGGNSWFAIKCNQPVWSAGTYHVTLRYTKTTD